MHISSNIMTGLGTSFDLFYTHSSSEYVLAAVSIRTESHSVLKNYAALKRLSHPNIAVGQGNIVSKGGGSKYPC